VHIPAIARWKCLDHGQAPELVEVLARPLMIDLQQLREYIFREPVRDGGRFHGVAHLRLVRGRCRAALKRAFVGRLARLAVLRSFARQPLVSLYAPALAFRPLIMVSSNALSRPGLPLVAKVSALT
jgi:hypothetical protein